MADVNAVTIGGYLVSADSEQFRIFPKNKQGQTTPITRINHFLYLRNVQTGHLTVMKRYLHMKMWYWKDSRDKASCDESQIVSEIARMLYKGDKDLAAGLVIRMLTGQPLAS